jgi:hypothetical protein
VAGPNTFGYALGNPRKFVDVRGLDVVGEWIFEPTAQMDSADVIDMTRLSSDDWSAGIDGYIKMFQLDVLFSGHISGVVKCTSLCEDKVWFVNGRTDVKQMAEIRTGPNYYVMAGSALVGVAAPGWSWPLVASKLGIMLAGNAAAAEIKTLHGLDEAAKEYGEKVQRSISTIHAVGPTKICKNGWPSIDMGAIR